MLTSICRSQREALLALGQLHNKGRMVEADFTWGRGSFWTGSSEVPRIRTDLCPGNVHLTTVCDVRDVPFRSGSIESAVADLPFIHAHGKASVIGRRFSSYPSQRALDTLHLDAAFELARVLKPGGLLIWKCQDIVESGNQVWNHVKIHAHAERFGLTGIDLIVLQARTVMVGWNHHVQRHARKVHSYFWAFRKGKAPR